MGCQISDMAVEDLDFDDVTTSSGSYEPSSPTSPDALLPGEIRKKPSDRGNGLLRHLRKSFSGSRGNLSRATRKSLEILDEKTSLVNFGQYVIRASYGTDWTTNKISSSERKSWTDPANGFQNLLNSCRGVLLFMQFLKMEYSDENLLFWLACERFKSEENIEVGAETIFEQFLTRQSPREVSLDSRVRERVTNKRGQPTRDMFDEAQGKIFSLMHRDSYPRFLGSDIYKKYVYK